MNTMKKIHQHNRFVYPIIFVVLSFFMFTCLWLVGFTPASAATPAAPRHLPDHNIARNAPLPQPRITFSAFVHTATRGNTTGFYTSLDNPVTNNNPNAVVVVTQNSPDRNSKPVGVTFNDLTNRWAIVTLDRSSIANGSTFNVIAYSNETRS